MNIRWRLARALVGPFVNIPERDGVWVVVHMDGGSGLLVIEAERFRLKSTSRLQPLDYDRSSPSFDFRPSRTFTRFVGTVKAR